MTDSESGDERLAWKRILAEGLAIVVSILLAFAIDAWWDGARERGREATVLQGLRTEFEANQEALEFNLSMHARVEEAAEMLLRLADGEDTVPTDSLGSLLSTVFISATSYNPTTGVLDGLLASGELGIIQDEELRTVLAAWPGLVEENAEDERWVFRDVQNTYTPFLNREVNTRFLWSESADATVIPDAVGASYTRVLRHPEFTDLVSMRAYGARALMDENDALADALSSILGRLEADAR